MKVSLSIIVVILSISSTTLATETEKEVNEVKEVKEETLSELNLTDDNGLEEELPEVNPDTELARRKKSTTTTFCVEIRPSGSQKPFQVCEPPEPAKPGEPAPAYAAPAPAYYPSSNYGAQEQTKTQVSYQPTPSPAYKPASQPKPAPAYSSGGKTFATASTSSSSSKTFSSNVPLPYSSYRSKTEENGGEEQSHDHMHMMRMTHASAEEEDANSSETKSDNHMRSSGYGSNFGSSGFGGPSSYVPVIPKSQHSKQHGHNGLVITCQPNLAGYAHNVPSSFHHPPSVPSYSYRSSTPRGYDRYNRFQQQQSFGGGYQQGPVFKSGPSIYKPVAPPPLPQPPVPKQPPPPHLFKPDAYEPAANMVYNLPVYKAPSSSYNPSPPHSQPPPPPPSPSYAPPPPPATYVSQITSSHQAAESSASSDYGGFAHSQPQQAASIPSAYGAPAPLPQLPPVSLYAPPPPPPTASYVSPALSSHGQQSFSSFSQAYAPAAPVEEHHAASYAAAPLPASSGPSSAYAPAPSYASPIATGPTIVPQAPSYVPPGTYRESENEAAKKTDTDHKDEKEKHTLKKMEGISHQRTVDSHWESEVSTDRTLAVKAEDHVGHPHQDWSSSMRSADDAEQLDAESTAMQRLETNQIANNEIENSS